MEEKINERKNEDVKRVSDGKRMFLKLGATALAALAFDSLALKAVAANTQAFKALRTAFGN